jgi:hypothetical protein
MDDESNNNNFVITKVRLPIPSTYIGDMVAPRYSVKIICSMIPPIPADINSAERIVMIPFVNEFDTTIPAD